jgi:protein-glucosylgalactosylhydroxylysine glucosidase
MSGCSRTDTLPEHYTLRLNKVQLAMLPLTAPGGSRLYNICLTKICIIFLLLHSLYGNGQPINRKAVTSRHNIAVTKADPLHALCVGNGRFAFTVDATGLQSFPLHYAKGISLGTQSEWGWHSFPNTAGYRFEETLKTYQLNGRSITYAVQWNEDGRNKDASNWYRQNPHRLQLGSIGFEILKKDGTTAQVTDVQNIRQELNLWTGEIRSHFTIEGAPVDVSTFCHADLDAISVKASSALISEGRLKIKILFPYPTGQWTDEGVNYDHPEKHSSEILLSNNNGSQILHRLDSTKYYLHAGWQGKGLLSKAKDHYFIITPAKGQNSFSFSAGFSLSEATTVPSYDATRISSETAWPSFWNSGGIIDFSGSADPGANELERRVVLSQYLMRAQEAGSYPPQETGLTYNSWFGRPHMEMHWWHIAHYALWGRIELFEKSLGWYATSLQKAKQIAQRQGFEGARWQKMTDNSGNETPSSVGAFLIWQQPHLVWFAELCYRERKDQATLDKYKELVFATADFMASYPYYEKDKDRYILGKGLIPAQETHSPQETFNPVYELAYWHWALSTAQQWRERLNLPRQKKWDEVLQKLSMPVIQENKYLFTENSMDAYTNPRLRTDHPSVLGAYGMLPLTKLVDSAVMRNTFNWIWNNWTWTDTWGWDFPMTAMTAARLGLPEKAIDALLMDVRTNTYLINGHNYQDERLRIYMPGNGGLLTAIAMMCAGWDGSTENAPGIPTNGKWKVRWEGLRKIP